MSSRSEWGASFAAAPVSAMSVYDEIMVPRMFEPWATLLLDEVEPQLGQAVLDVACGPGTVTRLAASRVGTTGRVTGCDFSPAMLEIARSKSPSEASGAIEYVTCAADALDVPDSAVDVVTCQQGLQFFPNRPAALAEMRRVLRPEGRLALAVWCSIDTCPPFAALGVALARVLGAETARSYESGPWGFGDSDALLRLITDGGFSDATLRTAQLPVVFEGGPQQLLLTLRATSVAPDLAQLPAEGLSALAAAVDEATRPLTEDGVVRSYLTSYVATATRGDAPG